MMNLFGAVLILAIIIAGPVGYVMNIVDLFELDFQAPYKAEVLRTAGIFIPPMGSVEGLFVTFEEEKKNAAN